MTLLATYLLFTIHIISSTVGSYTKDCSSLGCRTDDMNQQAFCVEVLKPNEPTVYIPMFECAAQEFKCIADNDVKVSYVKMSICYKNTPPMKPRRADPFPKSPEEHDNKLKSDIVDSQDGKQCPTECSTHSRMVCARCNHQVYRSFLSVCHMRMYQCRYPAEKLELVSRQACIGSAPYIMTENERQGKDRGPHNMDNDSETQVMDQSPQLKKLHAVQRNRVLEKRLYERDFKAPRAVYKTPKPTVHITWPSRRTRTKSTSRTVTKPIKQKTEIRRTTTKSRLTKPMTPATTTTTVTTQPPAKEDYAEAENRKEDIYYDVPGVLNRIDADTCPNDDDQETPISVPDVCTDTKELTRTNPDYMKVDLHPDQIEDGSPVWMVYGHGKRISSSLRADAGLVVGCEAYAGLDYSGQVVVRDKYDNDFLGFVFGYRDNSEFYLVSWKARSEKYWRGWPSVVYADAGVHIKLVNSSTGPGAYLRNALYSTESVKDQVQLLWQDQKKQGWKHLIMYQWQILHRPHIGLIRVKVFRGSELIVDSGNIYDKTIPGGRIGVYAFSQENIEWSKMDFKCNDKIPSNIMAELPADLQKISVVDNVKWNNDTFWK